MTDLKDTRITRREFVVAAGSIAGIAMMPGAVAGAPGAHYAAPVMSTSPGARTVICDFVSVDGLPRPCAWRLVDGTALEIEASDTTTEVHFRGPILGGQTLRVPDFQNGYAQELIRQRFGDEVLRQVTDELERFAMQKKKSFGTLF